MDKLYKYKPFGTSSLKSLCDSEVYYSDPKYFNDPLDCSPVLINDIELKELESLCHKMIFNKFGKEKADKEIENYKYLTTEYGDYNEDEIVHDYYVQMITDEIKIQLDLIMKSRGVLSLSSQWKSPLMWSHYADEHKGICIEYDISNSICEKPTKVDYAGGRGILISDLIDWVLNGSQEANAKVEYKYFYTKADQWSYEEEWRYVSESQGCRSLPFPITGIYFGMRCEASIISSIVKLMNGTESSISFFKAYAGQDSFELFKREIDIDELMACTPRPSAALLFAGIT